MWLGRRWEPSAAWAEALVVAFSAGYCARGAVTTRGERDELDLPVLLSAAVIVASLIVQVLVDSWRFGGATVRDQLWLLVRQDYLRISDRGRSRRCQPCDSWNRCCSSGPRPQLPARTPTFGPLLVRASVFGAAAAAAVNVLRLWEGALRLSSPLEVFGRYLLTQRFNAHYGDLNAAGSYFVLVVFPAVGLAVRQMWRWSLAALLIAALPLDCRIPCGLRRRACRDDRACRSIRLPDLWRGPSADDCRCRRDDAGARSRRNGALPADASKSD